MLDNINISLSDLQAKRSDIATLFHSGDNTFAVEENEAKKITYRSIKETERILHPSLTNAELAARVNAIKDYADSENIKDIICYLIISIVMESNNLYDEAAIYRKMSNQIPLSYFYDTDEDTVADPSEENNDMGGITFSR